MTKLITPFFFFFFLTSVDKAGRKNSWDLCVLLLSVKRDIIQAQHNECGRKRGIREKERKGVEKVVSIELAINWDNYKSKFILQNPYHTCIILNSF